MLHILIRSPKTEGAIPAVDVAEIVPLVSLQTEPGAAPSILGTMEYRGSALTVLDFGLLLGEERCAHLYSTRILILHTGQGLIGLLAQGVSDALAIESADLLTDSATGHKGQIARTSHGTLRIFHTQDLLALLPPQAGEQP